MRALVTGVSGFIGGNLLEELCLREEHEIIAVGRDKEDSLGWFSGNLIRKPFYELDWGSIGKIDILFHQAAVVDTATQIDGEVSFVNCDAAIELFRNAAQRGCKKIVYASSTAVYGNTRAPFVEGKGEEPLNAYGRSKLRLDKESMDLAKDFPDIRIVGLRYCNVYGPCAGHKVHKMNMTYKLAQQILTGNPKVFNYGEQRRDQIYVRDVVQANLLALNASESWVLNCGTGQTVSFNEMVAILNDVLGMDKKIIYIGEPHSSFQSHVECDMTRACEKIGFVPQYDYGRGVRDYYASGKLTA